MLESIEINENIGNSGLRRTIQLFLYPFVASTSEWETGSNFFFASLRQASKIYEAFLQTLSMAVVKTILNLMFYVVLGAGNKV